jgi:ADP-ribose pyrophosphatase
MGREVAEVRKRIVYHSPANTIRLDTVLFTDGRIEEHEVLQSPQGVLILPVTDDGLIVLTKEFRHNHGWVHSVPMGAMTEADLSPLDGAKRELREEAGLAAARWFSVSTHHNGIHEEGLNHFFIAEGLSDDDKKQDADEDIETAKMTFEEAFRLMDEGGIVDLRSRACIWAGYIYLQRKSKTE